VGWPNLRWSVVVATMAVTLAALFGGGFLLKNRAVNEPLALLYSQSPAVESYAVEEHASGYVITLKLKQTEDFAAIYAELARETARLLRNTPFTIMVQDGRTPTLTETFRRVNLYVEEALMTGRFAEMADRIEAEAASAGQRARCSVDSRRVYVELWDESGYLYSVTERPVVRPGLTLQMEEGGTGS